MYSRVVCSRMYYLILSYSARGREYRVRVSKGTMPKKARHFPHHLGCVSPPSSVVVQGTFQWDFVWPPFLARFHESAFRPPPRVECWQRGGDAMARPTRMLETRRQFARAACACFLILGPVCEPNLTRTPLYPRHIARTSFWRAMSVLIRTYILALRC